MLVSTREDAAGMPGLGKDEGRYVVAGAVSRPVSVQASRATQPLTVCGSPGLVGPLPMIESRGSPELLTRQAHWATTRRSARAGVHRIMTRQTSHRAASSTAPRRASPGAGGGSSPAGPLRLRRHQQSGSPSPPTRVAKTPIIIIGVHLRHPTPLRRGGPGQHAEESLAASDATGVPHQAGRPFAATQGIPGRGGSSGPRQPLPPSGLRRFATAPASPPVRLRPRPSALEVLDLGTALAHHPRSGSVPERPRRPPTRAGSSHGVVVRDARRSSSSKVPGSTEANPSMCRPAPAHESRWNRSPCEARSASRAMCRFLSPRRSTGRRAAARPARSYALLSVCSYEIESMDRAPGVPALPYFGMTPMSRCPRSAREPPPTRVSPRILVEVRGKGQLREN